jgi:DnaK suppressor protein
MNATVTKSTKKSVVAKDPAKAAPKPAPVAKTKPAAGKSTLKRVADKLARKIPGTLEPAAKPGKPRAKPAAKSAAAPAAAKKSGAVKNALQPSAKAANGRGRQTAKPAVATTAKTVSPAVNMAATAARVKQSGANMSSNKVAAGLADTIEKTVVLKVREVATKTMKSTPTVVADGTLLSEPQILKMGEKDYMNAAQLAFFKARLQQLEKDLLKNAGETTEHLRETVLVPDPADRATIEEEHALELRTRDRERKLLKKVQQSIASIDSGDYGWCEETGEPIGIPRLLARPTATLSLEAQQRRELKQKLYGD